MRRVFAGLAAALLVAAAPSAWAEPAADWLLKVSDAARQSNYQGVVVYRDARMLEVLRIVHRTRGGKVQERLTSLTGQPRDILREGDRVACFSGAQPAGDAGGVPQRLFPVLSAASLSQAAQHYEIREQGEARVAGRACRAVALAPRDEFRYGYEFCADTVTAVPLRMALLDAQGRVMEQLMFTEVSFPARIADAEFAPPPGAPAPAREEEVIEASAPTAVWHLARLPPGFRVIMRSQRADPDGGGAVEQVLVSDGLSAVSVFGARPGGGAPRPSGFTHMGAVNAYSRAVGAFQVTVVGEVPQGTVRLIGDGFQLVGEGARGP